MNLKAHLFLVLSLVLTANSFASDMAPAPKKSRCRLSYALLLSAALIPTGYAAVEHATTDPDTAQTEGFAKTPKNERFDVFVMGDSMASGDMAYGNLAETLLRTRSRRQVGWVLNLSKEDDGLKSLYDRYKLQYETRVTNAAWPGAYADGEALFVDRTAANLLGQIQNFSQQVKRCLNTKPNLVVISMFHNNLDFQFDLEKNPKLERESHLKEIPIALVKEYKKQLGLLVANRQPSDGKLSIVLLGAVNLETALKARDQARELHRKDPKQFPHLDMGDKNFPSTLPEHREDFLAVERAVNSGLNLLVKELSAEIKDSGKQDQIQITYSDAMSAIDFSDIKYLHPEDGLHTSVLAKELIAESVEKALIGPLEFIGPKSR